MTGEYRILSIPLIKILSVNAMNHLAGDPGGSGEGVWNVTSTSRRKKYVSKI